MYDFFDSNFFQSAVILFTGAFVFVNYYMNKRDEEKRAATILIMEIREMEDSLAKLRELRSSIYFSEPVTKGNSWDVHRTIFINRLDQDEYKLISDFYLTAMRIEKEREILINQVSAAFETKCRSLHQYVVEIAKEDYDKESTEFISRANKMAEKVYMDTPMFEASMPRDVMNSLLRSISEVTTTTAGAKIKKIAALK